MDMTQNHDQQTARAKCSSWEGEKGLLTKLILHEFFRRPRSTRADMSENQGAKTCNFVWKAGAQIAVPQRMDDRIRPKKAPADLDVLLGCVGDGLVASQ